VAKFAIDLTPLKKYPDFRNLWTAGLISYMGSMITYVAMPFQLKEITNSYLAVGLLGAVEIIPLILFGLYGGVLADSVDRKKMVWATEAGALILVAILLANSWLWEPKVSVIYIVAGLFAMVSAARYHYYNINTTTTTSITSTINNINTTTNNNINTTTRYCR